MFAVFFGLLIAELPSEEEMARSPIQISGLKELHDEEVAASGELVLESAVSDADFKACAALSSEPFPRSFSNDHEAQIFTEEETKALNDCEQGDCKFNFLPSEIIAIHNAADLETRKKLFFRFYEERTRGLKGIDPHRSSKFIRSADQPFDECEGEDFNRLLNARPLKNTPYRLSIVKYDRRMRPTTRLTQGVYWTGPKDQLCFAEALIFSDHYDVDRVQLWSLKKTATGASLKIQLRTRIDLLNSWVRRLSKEKFRKQVKQIVFNEISMLDACLKERRKVRVTPIEKTP